MFNFWYYNNLYIAYSISGICVYNLIHWNLYLCIQIKIPSKIKKIDNFLSIIYSLKHILA